MDKEMVFRTTFIVGQNIVIAKYVAWSFFQARVGRPITDAEMEQIATGVNAEIGQAMKDALALFGPV